LPLHLNIVKNLFEAVLKMFCASPSAVAPRRKPMGPYPWGRRAERNQGCLAIARQDKVGEPFLNSPEPVEIFGF